MKKIIFLAIILPFIFLNSSVCSQNNASASNDKIENIKKNQFIYLKTFESINTTKRENYSTGKTSSASSRIINFYFTVGVDGPNNKIGKKGEMLEKYIKNDSQAYAEFNKAREHQKKSKKYNIIQLLGYPLALAGVVPLVIGLYKKSDTGEVDYGLFTLGGVGVVGGFVLINVWGIKCDKELDAFITSINNSVAIYNQNLLEKNKKIGTGF